MTETLTNFIDIPNSCYECTFYFTCFQNRHICALYDCELAIEYGKKKPEWCTAKSFTVEYYEEEKNDY